MKTRNQGFENSLCCLQHPATLLSIALLLLNDHVLKVVSPSWLTGKLSDFAGLFFFPFIVAVVLSILLAGLNLKRDTIGKLSFGIVAAGFVLVKTTPSVNQASSLLVSNLIGHPVRLLLDVSDTLALIVLYPGWNLWKLVSARKIGRAAYVSLILGVLASVATSPALPEVEVVTHLESNGEILFAFDATNGTMAVSDDGGKTWDRIEESELDDFPRTMEPMPMVVCLPDPQKECYRINGEKVVEESNDGGTTWKISWQLPAARLPYIMRINPEIDLGTYDLLITQWEDHGYILVAAGEEGILRRELPNGEWERIRVRNAEPTPYRATSISRAFSNVWGELSVWFLLSILPFIIACQVIWSSNSKDSTQQLNKIQWVYLPALSPILGIASTLILQALIGLVFYAIFVLATAIDRTLDIQFVLLSALVACLAAALLALPATIHRILKKWRAVLINHNYSPQTASKLVWRSYLTHISVFMVGTVNWIFWALGVISKYEITWISAIASAGLVATILIRHIGDLSKQNNAV